MRWPKAHFECLAGIFVLFIVCKPLKPVAILCQAQQPVQALDLPAAAFHVQ